MFHVWKSEVGTTAARALFLNHLTSHNKSIVYYTDKSRTEHGARFSVVRGDHVVLKKILQAASSYTAELYAVLAALVAFCSAPTESVTIVSDCSSALQGILNHHIPYVQPYNCL
ncbi:Ribonuclease H-like domain [Trinorchestia longiramus]|nr:Ribonuclease H-like domain [Trinorchestia longiramus]